LFRSSEAIMGALAAQLQLPVVDMSGLRKVDR
jgi:hypothetical protein